jgi:lipopolysaccharide biosynthesis glycosyltransferase
MAMIRIFIGYDSKEPVAYHVAAHSILARATRPVSITPLQLGHLGEVFRRERDPRQSTEFSFSRFLVPHLCGYEGWGIFLDCDVLVLDDITRLWELRDERFAVQVVKHDHRPKEGTKFLGQEQTSYPCKNWSSVMLMNAARCRALTPEYVSTAGGLELHRFLWLEGMDLVGELPARWNHLVDYDAALPVERLSLLHYTSGGPWFPGYEACGYADLWRGERDRALGGVRE